jgi:hypothetical protein
MVDLRKDILLPVARRIRKRCDSLRAVERFKRSGIEAWFKVEVAAALGNKVRRLHNKGPDLEMKDGMMVELKGATDLNIPYLIKDGLRNRNTPCLFLGCTRLKPPLDPLFHNVSTIGIKVITRGDKYWVIGIIKRKREYRGKIPNKSADGLQPPLTSIVEAVEKVLGT